MWMAAVHQGSCQYRRLRQNNAGSLGTALDGQSHTSKGTFLVDYFVTWTQYFYCAAMITFQSFKVLSVRIQNSCSMFWRLRGLSMHHYVTPTGLKTSCLTRAQTTCRHTCYPLHCFKLKSALKGSVCFNSSAGHVAEWCLKTHTAFTSSELGAVAFVDFFLPLPRTDNRNLQPAIGKRSLDEEASYMHICFVR